MTANTNTSKPDELLNERVEPSPNDAGITETDAASTDVDVHDDLLATLAEVEH